MKKIIIDWTNIDDLFIYKHKIESDIAKKKNEPISHMKIDDFINYLNLYDTVYYCKTTNESVAFAIMNIEDENICFCTKASEKTMNSFDDKMNIIKWDIKKLVEKKPQDIYDDIDNIDFFIINKNICLINENH